MSYFIELPASEPKKYLEKRKTVMDDLVAILEKSFWAYNEWFLNKLSKLKNFILKISNY